MTIPNVHYWHLPDTYVPKTDSTTLPASDDPVKASNALFQDYGQSFDSALFDVLGQGSFSSHKMYSSSFFGYDLNSSDQLRDATKKAKEMGMEKVLAAQLASPIPYSSNFDNDNKTAYDGLNNIANLTIQLAMAKARKVFDHMNNKKTMGIDEYLKFLEP